MPAEKINPYPHPYPVYPVVVFAPVGVSKYIFTSGKNAGMKCVDYKANLMDQVEV